VYEEKEDFHVFGSDWYHIEIDFAFNCEVMHFIDDKVRIRFFNDFDNPIKGDFLNTSKSYNSTGEVPASAKFSN